MVCLLDKSVPFPLERSGYLVLTFRQNQRPKAAKNKKNPLLKCNAEISDDETKRLQMPVIYNGDYVKLSAHAFILIRLGWTIALFVLGIV